MNKIKSANRLFLLLAATGILLAGAACQMQDQATRNDAANHVNSSIENANAGNSAESNAASGAAKEQTINFAAPDGVQIVGTFYPSAKENAPAVLMLHQFGGSRASYKDLARQFQKSGIAVLAIDGRGFGDSTKRADGSRLAPSQSNETVAGMKTDVAAAIKFLSEQKNVDKTRVGIAGASYGSSLAIIYAADDASIKSVALLSPGTNYFGNLPTEPVIQKYGARAVLIVAAEDDQESAEAARRLDKLAGGDKHRLQIYGRGGHGTGILNAGVGLDGLLLEFFQKNL